MYIRTSQVNISVWNRSRPVKCSQAFWIQPVRNASAKGKPLCEQHVSNFNGVHDVLVTTNGEVFYDIRIFYHNYSHLMALTHHSIVVMDNCPVHHIPEIHSCNDQSSTSNWNGILVKDLEESMVHGKIETIMLIAFASISSQDCQGWISHKIHWTVYLIVASCI